MMLLLPVNDDEIYGWAAAVGSQTGHLKPRLTAELFDGFPAVVRRALDSALGTPDRILHSPLDEVRPSVWGHGRIALIGDAAHATAPVWAQGAALALEDAIALADILMEQGDWSQVAKILERKRAARTSHIARMTDRMSRTAQLPIWLRNALLPIVGAKSYRATYAPLQARPDEML